MITADQARLLVKQHNIRELDPILNQISNEASKGNSRLYWYKPMGLCIIKELSSRGFVVESTPSIAQQKDGLFYVIKW